jgi:tRNA A37 threonylcarbamoyladenosine modification protein TsaB
MQAPTDSIFFQTALSGTFVALLSGLECIDHVNTYLDFKSDNVYVWDAGNLMARNLIKPSHLSRVYVLVGPGYFTGIRSGLVIAKALLDSLSLEVGLIDSFEYLRACLMHEGDCAIVVAASRKEGYIAYFSGREKVREEMISLTQIESIQKETKLFSETTFIQEIYSVEPITAIPVIPPNYKLVRKSCDIVPHYVRSESDLFRTSL